jgi:hypothetical protein
MANPFPFVANTVLTAAQLNGIGEYAAFTPSFTNFTLGNGTATFRFGRVQEFVHVIGRIVLGSTSSVTGNMIIAPPVAMSGMPTGSTVIGQTFVQDSGTSEQVGIILTNGTNLFVQAMNVASTYPFNVGFTSTVPFTWAVNDTINISCIYEA